MVIIVALFKPHDPGEEQRKDSRARSRKKACGESEGRETGDGPEALDGQ